MALRYEIRNKKNEVTHPFSPGKCEVRKMTDEEWAKYGPASKKKRKGSYLNDLYCFGRKITNGRKKQDE